MLDTHSLLWWLSGHSELSENAGAAIERELQESSGAVLVSAISAWEIGMLVNLNRLTLTMSVDDWLEAAADVEGVRFVPVDNATAVESTRLPGEFHKDPADRMIVALARHLNVPLITADKKIRDYKHVRSIW
ncbi:type II toxin-antitoxin system VapC family toxin [Haliea sp. E1-2-M8]|uniref:type II toxin-antitoxin system VapC family toxin n=1 Tax=Haliea sp. E1-2-M8 TaxID=3064706 RepID=UPI002724F4F6|nr:type II toxin-antitoxin system VapC family toxin [Haliea sp. E1-2-M8]MDO8860409.1 type II toxin-antitoxin system VapC family toxin [Haliea sp. E1-2-M8]